MFPELPLLVFRASIWSLLLSDPADCGNLRLACRQARSLVDLLISSACVHMGHSALEMADAEEHLVVKAAGRRQAWRASAAQRVAFLARLPALQHLTIRHWPSETADLMPWLLRLGTASGGRVTRLALADGTLTLASACAIHMACPELEDLSLGYYNPKEDSRVQAHLEGDFFLGLPQPTLTKLSLGYGCTLSTGVMSSLVGLSHLQSLSLNVPVSLAELRSLSGLSALSHFTISNGVTYPLVQAAALFTLTHLTHLHFDSVRHDAPYADDGTLPEDSHDSGAWPVTGADDDAPAAALALLGGLVRLQSLGFGRDYFTVDDAVFSALCQLTQLTSLKVARILLTRDTPPGGRHLPLLRHLSIFGHDSPHRSPSQLLRSLQPLLPLPSLTDLSVSGVDVTDRRGDAAAEGAALREAAQHLAAAPCLGRLHLSMISTWRDGAQLSHLSLTQLGEGLRPLARTLDTLKLQGLDLRWAGREWGVLGGALPRLRTLSLYTCGLTGACMAAMAVHLPAVSLLEVYSFSGVTREGWLMMSAARVTPLTVKGSQFTPAAVEERQRVQEVVYGVQNITWHGL